MTLKRGVKTRSPVTKKASASRVPADGLMLSRPLIESRPAVARYAA